MGYKQILCNSIKKLRNEQGLTQEKFGEAIGLSIEAVRNIEQCKSTPTAKTIDKICETFNIKIVELLLEKPTTEKSELIKLINNKLSTFTIDELLRLNDIIDTLHKTY